MTSTNANLGKSERHYLTDRGYAMIAAKLEDEGYEATEVCNIIDEVRTW